MAFTRGKMSRGRLGNGNGDELLRTLKHELGDKLHHDDGDTYQIGDHTGHNQHHSAQYHERTLEPLQAPAEEEALEAGGQQIGANERGNQAPEDVQHAALHQQYRIVDKQVRHEEGIDQPVLVQYGKWLDQALHGDFGKSYSTRKPAFEELKRYFPQTFKLAVTSFLLLMIVSIPLGILSAIYENRVLDKVIRILSSLSVSMPSFWIGLMLLYIFGVKLKVISVI